MVSQEGGGGSKTCDGENPARGLWREEDWKSPEDDNGSRGVWQGIEIWSGRLHRQTGLTSLLWDDCPLPLPPPSPGYTHKTTLDPSAPPPPPEKKG